MDSELIENKELKEDILFLQGIAYVISFFYEDEKMKEAIISLETALHSIAERVFVLIDNQKESLK